MSVYNSLEVLLRSKVRVSSPAVWWVSGSSSPRNQNESTAESAYSLGRRNSTRVESTESTLFAIKTPSEARPLPGMGEEGLLCVPGSEVRLCRKERKKRSEDSKWDGIRRKKKHRKVAAFPYARARVPFLHLVEGRHGPASCAVFGFCRAFNAPIFLFFFLRFCP